MWGKCDFPPGNFSIQYPELNYQILHQCNQPQSRESHSWTLKLLLIIKQSWITFILLSIYCQIWENWKIFTEQFCRGSYFYGIKLRRYFLKRWILLWDYFASLKVSSFKMVSSIHPESFWIISSKTFLLGGKQQRSFNNKEENKTLGFLCSFSTTYNISEGEVVGNSL